jgi:hypothetical protein
MPPERVKPGGTVMKKKALTITLASFLLASSGAAIACEYKAGETKFLDYANCKYGEDSIQAIALPEDATWEICIYYLEAFRPPKLLAVTQQQDGKEMLSINDRSKIGNPCYITKQHCDAAYKVWEQNQ